MYRILSIDGGGLRGLIPIILLRRILAAPGLSTFLDTVDLIAGGVYANNPSMCALAQTQDPRYAPNPPLSHIRLFSLGTGVTPQYIQGKTLDWGYAQWAKPFIRLMLDGTAGIADYQCRRLLADRYHRLSPAFPENANIGPDDVDKIPELIDFAQNTNISATLRWLKKQWLSVPAKS